MLANSDNIFTKSLKVGLCYFLFLTAILLPVSSHAVYDGTRDSTFSTAQNRCNVGRLEFLPFGGNKDTNWELTNPTCIGFVAGAGASLLAAEIASSYACLQPQLAAEAAISNASGFPLTPAILKRRAQEAAKCTALLSAQAYTTAALCCGSMSATIVTTGIVIGVLATLWDQAGLAFESARICGHNWATWEQKQQDVGGFTPGKTVWVKTKGPHLRCLENIFMGANHGNYSSYCEQNSSMSITNKSYREFIYGGVEYRDNGNDSCKNPSTWDGARRSEILGYTSDDQRYYMRGPGNVSVFACYRFNAAPKDEADRTAMQIAYDCCKKRSQEAICIENRRGFGYATGNPTYGPYGHKFCNLGSRCDVEGTIFEAYQSIKNSSYGCAKTYSVCPYNHLLGGGTEEEEINPSDKSTIVNYCQVMNHCSKLPILPYVYNSGLEGGHIAKACRDLKGDSQNVYGYTAQLLPINTRGFSAPLVQCFKETMENIFLHKAGHSSCLDPEEDPINDVCVSGYNYRRGGDLPGKSFFGKVQDNLQEVIKMALIASVIAFGFAILKAVPGAHITRKVLIGYILKIGIVMYFAVGDAWQFGFMQGVIGTSSFLADLTFKIDEAKPLNKLDGCQFPRYDYRNDNPTTKYNDPKYPPTKEYLRIWDTLDCKIARALGFGPEVSVPNLVMAIVGGFFTGGLGIIFFVATFVFAFFLLSMTIKAMHTFIMSITSVIILLYVSPITITLAFFERTKGIFQGWWKQLLGFTLQPMILFAYLGILVTLLDNFILGSATFIPATVEVNGVSVQDTYGRISPKQISCSGDAEDDSLYCIFKFSDIKTFNGLEAIGIGIPLLTSLNSNKLDTIFKAAIVMFIFSTFMDQIMGLASKLVGGSSLQSDWGSSTSKMLAKAYGVARGIQSRGVNAMRKHAPGILKKVASVPRDTVKGLSSKGKKTESTAAGSDHVKEKDDGGGSDNVKDPKEKGEDGAIEKVAGKAGDNVKPKP